MIYLVNSHTNAARIGWHLCEIDSRFAPGLPSGWTEGRAASAAPILYRGTSLIRKRLALGPYSSPMPRALWWSEGGRRFLMSEVPLYGCSLMAKRGRGGARRFRGWVVGLKVEG